MVKKKLTEGIAVDVYAALTIGGPLTGEAAARWRRYQIMRAMGWTYRDYQRAPAWLVTEVEAFMRTEAKAQEEMSQNGRART